MISMKEYFMGRDVTFANQLTPEIQMNAVDLLSRVNALLTELGINRAVTSSGWRPASINLAVPGAAKKSLHMVGKAIDLEDVGHIMYNKILTKPELLEKYGLWLEDKASTNSWCHLDSGARPPRSIRVFKP